MNAVPRPQKFEAACAGDNTVAALLAGALDSAAARSLELHLDACAACRRLVAELGRGLSAIGAAPGAAARRLPEVGETIGRFAIERVLGVGGMGVVYQARDRALGRTVAVKLLRPDLVDGDPLLGEAQAMAKLSHPNVAVVHDVGSFRGQLYVCMEYVAGGTLRGWLAERARGWREIVDVFRAAGRGLAYVHAAGLVHRDFKPDNVLIGRDGRVVVSDFGLAHAIGHRHAAALVGTPAYMAPEQRRGERCDARADQYAFCVALREALGERRPAWLANAIERGLAPRPADRFASMDALLAALERHSRRRARPLAVLAVVAAAAAAAASVPRDGETRTRVVDRPVIQRVVAPAPAPAPAGERAIAPASPVALHEPTRAPRDAQIVVRDVPVAASVAPLWLARATVDESGASMIVSPRASRASDRPALPAIESYGGMTLAPDCDDGSERRCTLAEPLCARPAIVAVQDGCWRCVDATTCEPIAELAAVGTAAGHSHGAPQGSNAGSNTGADHGSDNGPGPGSGGGSGGSGFGPDGNPL